MATQHGDWERQRERLRASVEDDQLEKAARIADLIATTPADSISGVAVQARLAAEMYGAMQPDHDCGTLGSALYNMQATLNALSNGHYKA